MVGAGPAPIDPYISPLVIEEISRGDESAAQKRLDVVEDFPLLEVVPGVHGLAGRYFRLLDLPDKARADAYHMALAVWHGLDYIVTWNCVHIASGRVLRIIDQVNTSENIRSPIICTPEELMEV